MFALFAYFIGSITFGRVVGFFSKTDLTKEGSGNVGATNAGRSLGAKGFVLVMLGDMLKVSLTGLIFHFVIDSFNINTSMPLALSFGVLGNNFPIYFKFKGGKGVASTLGFIFVTS